MKRDVAFLDAKSRGLQTLIDKYANTPMDEDPALPSPASSVVALTATPLAKTATVAAGGGAAGPANATPVAAGAEPARVAAVEAKATASERQVKALEARIVELTGDRNTLEAVNSDLEVATGAPQSGLYS